VHVEEAQEHANAHTGKNQDVVQSAIDTLPSFNRDAEAAHEKPVDVEDIFAVPVKAMFTPFSS
jgi:hypothetical protein